MVEIPIGCSREVVLEVICEWVELLAQERYFEAYEMTYHGHSLDEQLTPEVIKNLVTNYGQMESLDDGRSFHVTSMQEVRIGGRDNPYQEVRFFDKNKLDIVGYIDFDLPLNGEWIDLTATFKILEIEDVWVLWLEDIHVL